MSNSAMREALKKIDRLVWDKHRHTKEEVEAHRLATEALSSPRLNCEVGTAEEQIVRFRKTAQDVYHTLTLEQALAWAQMTYDESEASNG